MTCVNCTKLDEKTQSPIAKTRGIWAFKHLNAQPSRHDYPLREQVPDQLGSALDILSNCLTLLDDIKDKIGQFLSWNYCPTLVTHTYLPSKSCFLL